MSKKYFKKGETLEKERTGLVNKNKCGSLMKIIKYNNAIDIFVQFEKGKPLHTTWRSFYQGTVTSPYDKTVYGLGYIGDGKYKVSENGKHTIQYNTWNTMLQRCYDSKRIEKFPTYKNVIVCPEWHCFQNFAKWYEDNYYEIEGERMVIDKDILFKGNQIYSPSTCVFVPEKINILFTKSNSSRGDFPIGVSYNVATDKYQASCNKNNKLIYLGLFNYPEEAFLTYKAFKEKLIKQTAEEYKDKLPNKLYEALINYKVEITD